MIPNYFGSDPLDVLDRSVIEVICTHGREGQSFNKLVKEVKPLASRSTFALRAKRLERFGYIEKFPDTKDKQAKRVRGKPMILLAARIVARMKVQCKEVEQSLIAETKKIEAKKGTEYNDQELEEIKETIGQISERINGVFSLIGTYAVLLGESLAGDLILPMVVDDFRSVTSALQQLLSLDKRVLHALSDNKLSKIPLDSLRGDFAFAFGKSLSEALPKFRAYLEASNK